MPSGKIKIITTYRKLQREFLREDSSIFFEEQDIYFSSSMVADGLMKKREYLEKIRNESGKFNNARDYRVIKVKPFSNGHKKLFFVHYFENLSAGGFAKVFRAYALTRKKRKRKGQEVFKVEHAPYIVKKLNAEQAKSSIGFKNVQYYGGEGFYIGKNSAFLFMQQFGLFDLRYYLSLQKDKYIYPEDWNITYTSLSTYSRQLSEWGLFKPGCCLNFFFHLLPSEKVKLAKEIIKEVRETHRGNREKKIPPLLHRDLKPENIEGSAAGVNEDNSVEVKAKIIDWDSSILIEDDGCVRVNNNPGTFLYAAPETFSFQGGGTKVLTTASDLYCFCPMFAEMFGADPWTLYQAREKARSLKGEPRRRFIDMGYLVCIAFLKGSFFIPKASSEVKEGVVFVLEKLQMLDPTERPDSTQLLKSLGKLYEIARAIETGDKSKDIYNLCQEMKQAVIKEKVNPNCSCR